MSLQDDGFRTRLERDVTLGDGSILHLRPVRAEDRAALQQLHDHDLGDTSAYYRFFGIRPHVSNEFLDSMTRFDPRERATIVALSGDRIVGVGSYNRETVESAEVAFAVADDAQGHGIGTLLLEDLAVLARAAGFTQLVAHTLTGNRAMLSVFAHAGLRERHRASDGVVDIELDLHDDAEMARRSDERAWAAQAASVRPYLAPRSVVVIGAGSSPSSPGHRIAVNARAHFTGDLAVVRPDGASVGGVTGYRSIREVPFAVDLAVIAVPPNAAAQVIEECGQAGVHAVVVITAGFSESGAHHGRTDRDLVDLAHRSGMRLLGPNCFGIIAPAVGLDATFSPVPAVAGSIAFGSQSGGLGLAVLAEAAERGIGLSSFISLGNRADVSSNDLLCAWADDPATSVIMLYLESLGNPRQFLRIARHVSASKPIIVLKAGRTSSGRRGAASHTASLASDDAAVGALLDAAGVIRVDTLEEMLDLAQFLTHQRAPMGKRVALVGNAGGPLILAADRAETVGLEVPTLSDTVQRAIRERVPNAAATSNPVDLLATVMPDAVADVVALIEDSGEVDSVVIASVGVRPEEDRNLDHALNGAEAQAGAVAEPPKRAIPVAVSVAGIPARLSTRSVFRYSESAVGALARAQWWWSTGRRRSDEASSGTVQHLDVDWLAVRRLVRSYAAPSSAVGDWWLEPDSVHEVLRVCGIPVAPSGIAASPEEAMRLADQSAGTGTVVMKAVVPGLLHKTEAGAVRMGVAVADAADVYREFARRFPSLTGVLVQQQVEGGAELLVGARQDPSAGPLVVIAAGGIEAELLRDRIIRAAPLDHVQARSALLALQTSARLTGFRGRPMLDLDAVAEVVRRVAHLAAFVPELVEFEINPLIVARSGSTAVDARIRVALGPDSVTPLRAG